jgi:uncharacterized protein (DUF736 family)
MQRLERSPSLTEYKQVGDGAIFTNDDGTLEGSFEVDGTKHRVAGRRKQTRDGKQIIVMEIELGSLWPNEHKKNENQPDMTGKVSMDGKLLRAAVWERTSKNSGKKFLSVKLTEEVGQPQQEAIQINDGDVPF